METAYLYEIGHILFHAAICVYFYFRGLKDGQQDTLLRLHPANRDDPARVPKELLEAWDEVDKMTRSDKEDR